MKRFYIPKSVYVPKLVSKTSLLSDLKNASIDQTKKVASEAGLVPVNAGKLTICAG